MACGQVSMQLGSGRPVYSVGFNPAQHGLIAAGGGAKMLHAKTNAGRAAAVGSHRPHLHRDWGSLHPPLCTRSWAYPRPLLRRALGLFGMRAVQCRHSLLGLLSRRSRRRCQGVAIEQPPIQSGRHSPLGHAMPYESTSPSHPAHRAWAVSVPLSCPKRLPGHSATCAITSGGSLQH